MRSDSDPETRAQIDLGPVESPTPLSVTRRNKSVVDFLSERTVDTDNIWTVVRCVTPTFTRCLCVGHQMSDDSLHLVFIRV